jgi:enamine deaminase RidA (YjgF/YER057c/UK114 family)
MTTMESARRAVGRADATFSRGEIEEMSAMGLVDGHGAILALAASKPQVARRRISALDVLNEASDYSSGFTRGLAVTMEAGARMLWLSGTASIDERGRTVHVGDFRAQQWRTYRNLGRLLESEGATWADVVRTSCYLRDIERDYDEFNKVRNLFFKCMAVDPLPASTGIQARLCRSDLLIEIEAFAVVRAAART